MKTIYAVYVAATFAAISGLIYGGVRFAQQDHIQLVSNDALHYTLDFDKGATMGQLGDVVGTATPVRIETKPGEVMGLGPTFVVTLLGPFKSLPAGAKIKFTDQHQPGTGAAIYFTDGAGWDRFPAVWNPVEVRK